MSAPAVEPKRESDGVRRFETTMPANAGIRSAEPDTRATAERATGGMTLARAHRGC